jgi:hypothetical protein
MDLGPRPCQVRGCADHQWLSGKGYTFDEAIGAFSLAYADQTERDDAALVKAVHASRLEALVEESALHHLHATRRFTTCRGNHTTSRCRWLVDFSIAIPGKACLRFLRTSP